MILGIYGKRRTGKTTLAMEEVAKMKINGTCYVLTTLLDTIEQWTENKTIKCPVVCKGRHEMDDVNLNENDCVVVEDLFDSCDRWVWLNRVKNIIIVGCYIHYFPLRIIRDMRWILCYCNNVSAEKWLKEVEFPLLLFVENRVKVVSKSTWDYQIGHTGHYDIMFCRNQLLDDTDPLSCLWLHVEQVPLSEPRMNLVTLGEPRMNFINLGTP